MGATRLRGSSAFPRGSESSLSFRSVFPEQDVGKTGAGGQGEPLSQGETRDAGRWPLAAAAPPHCSRSSVPRLGSVLPISLPTGGGRGIGREAGGGCQGDEQGSANQQRPPSCTPGALREAMLLPGGGIGCHPPDQANTLPQPGSPGCSRPPAQGTLRPCSLGYRVQL